MSDRATDRRPSAMPCPVTAASISAFVSVKEGPAISRSSFKPADLNQACHDKLRSISSGCDNIEAGPLGRRPPLRPGLHNPQNYLSRRLTGLSAFQSPVPHPNATAETSDL